MALPSEVKLSWRSMRLALYTTLITYAFAVGQLHWAPPEFLKGFMDLVTLVAFAVLIWHLLENRTAKPTPPAAR